MGILFWFVLFAAANIGIGALAARRADHSREDYLLAGRSLGALAVGLSAAATANSGFIMLGAVGLGYAYGITWVFLPLAWFLGDLLFWKMFPHRFNALAATSKSTGLLALIVPDGISGWRRGRLVASLVVSAVLITYGGSQVLAGAKALNAVFGVTMWIGGAAVVVVVAAYSLFGGFRASVWTDLFQGAVMVAVTVWMVSVSISGVVSSSSNWEYLLSVQGHLVPFAGIAPVGVAAFVVGWSSAALGYGLSQPHVVTRYIAGRDVATVRRSKWVYLMFIQSTWVGMTLFGVLARGLVRDLADPELALLAYSKSSFHEVGAALVLVAVFSAIASTLDSLVLAVGSIVSGDALPAIRGIPPPQNRTLDIVAAASTLIVIYFVAVGSTLNVFQLSVLPVELVAASVGPAAAIRLLFGVRAVHETLTVLVSGVVGVAIWRYFRLEATCSSAVVGVIVFGIAVFYLLRRSQLQTALTEESTRLHS